MLQNPAVQPSLFPYQAISSAASGIQLPLMTDLQNPLPWVLRLHQATQLHYDLRFVVGSALISFVLYNPPSLNPSRWVRAKMVGNQKAEHMLSEWRVPEGRPGAGPTMPVERGTYVPRLKKHSSYEMEMLAQLAAGDVRLELTGHFLRGGWRLSGAADSWLLRKVDDEFASSSAELSFDRSILTGRRLEDIH